MRLGGSALEEVVPREQPVPKASENKESTNIAFIVGLLQRGRGLISHHDCGWYMGGLLSAIVDTVSRSGAVRLACDVVF